MKQSEILVKTSKAIIFAKMTKNIKNYLTCFSRFTDNYEFETSFLNLLAKSISFGTLMLQSKADFEALTFSQD